MTKSNSKYLKNIKAYEKGEAVYLDMKQYSILCWIMKNARHNKKEGEDHYYIYDTEIQTYTIAKELKFSWHTVNDGLKVLKGEKMLKVYERRIAKETQEQFEDIVAINKIEVQLFDKNLYDETEKIDMQVKFEEMYYENYHSFLSSHTYLFKNETIDGRVYYTIKMPETYIPLSTNTLDILLLRKNGGYYIETLGYITINMCNYYRHHKGDFRITAKELMTMFNNDKHAETIRMFQDILRWLNQNKLISFDEPILRTNKYNKKRQYYEYLIKAVDLNALDNTFIPEEKLDITERKTRLPKINKEMLETYLSQR